MGQAPGLEHSGWLRRVLRVTFVKLRYLGTTPVVDPEVAQAVELLDHLYEPYVHFVLGRRQLPMNSSAPAADHKSSGTSLVFSCEDVVALPRKGDPDHASGLQRHWGARVFGLEDPEGGLHLLEWEIYM